MHRYFFHSFPRRRGAETRDAQLAKAVKIAESLLKNGLLLTPENFRIPILGRGGAVMDHLEAAQRRACFTELEPAALPEHASTFGPFSLVYEIPELRRLGALPVFYIPLQGSGDHLSGLATELIGGLADSSRLVSQLHAARRHLANDVTLKIDYRGRSVTFGQENVEAIRFFLDVMADGAACDLDATQANLGTIVSCFYPTENPEYTEPLHYYRQREWRIIGGTFTFEGQPWVIPANRDQVNELMNIDGPFFGKELEFSEPKHGIGAKVNDTIANRSHFLKNIGTLDAVGLAAYLVVADDAVIDNELIDAFLDRTVQVVKESEFCSRGA